VDYRKLQYLVGNHKAINVNLSVKKYLLYFNDHVKKDQRCV